ncbi:MAG: ammonium transporter, partial [Actinomycetales bacterium]
ATGAAIIGWIAVEFFRDKKGTSLGAASGAVAGLVAITPAAGALSPFGSIFLGLVAGVLCALAVGLKYKLGYDDSLDVVGVHLVGGLVGTILIGLLASSDVTSVDGLFYGGGVDQLGKQLVAAGVTLAYSFAATAAIVAVLDRTIGFRVDPDHETQGVDLVIHAEAAYDLHALSGTRPHLGGHQ